jgi:hypothetical protein
MSSYFLITILSLISSCFALELWCEDKMYSIPSHQQLIYVSLTCVPCTEFIKAKNDVVVKNLKDIKNIPLDQLKEKLPWLVFKENKPTLIERYKNKNKLLNRTCIAHKSLKECLSSDITPQIVDCSKKVMNGH